jgi:predicted dinucleotide-binding enzyme
MDAGNTRLVIGHTTSGVEELARKAPKSKAVSASNTASSELLLGVCEARRKAYKPSLIYCGDDGHGKEVASALIRDVGFEPVDALLLLFIGIHKCLECGRLARLCEHAG